MGAAVILLLVTACAFHTPATDDAIPFEFVKNQIIVTATINGAGPYSFVLDTGVTPSVIDTSMARAAGVAVDTSRSGEASGAGRDVVKVHPVTLGRLTVGRTELVNVDGLAVDLSKLSQSLGRPLHGILGENFFADRVVTIDYPSKRVLISRSAGPLRPGAIELPFTFAPDDIIPIIQDFEIAGRKIPVSLDTGSSLGIELYPEAVDRLALHDLRASAEPGTITGARGEAGVRRSRIDLVRIGGLPGRDVAVSFSERTDHGPERLGNVGNALLSRFLVTFDYTRRRVRFEERE